MKNPQLDHTRAAAQYGELMWVIRKRFDVIKQIGMGPQSDFSIAETAAFHLRKIIEAIAFGALVACENGIKAIPKDAKGQWNADVIFARLEKRGLSVFPSPSVIRAATAAEIQEHRVKATVEGQPERRLSSQELRSIYRETHRWLHERNPYVWKSVDIAADVETLWNNIQAVWRFVERHFIGIAGEAFFCTLIDSADGQTKVVPLSKIAA